jgi:hypothetical protein
MLPVIPWYFAVIDVALSVGIVIVLWTLFSAVASRGFRASLALFLGVWLVAALVTAVSPPAFLSRRQFLINPMIPIFGVVPAVIVILAFVFSPTVRRALASVSLPALHAIQVYRLAGLTFIALLAQGQLPAHFALPAGWGDTVIGATAIPIAYALARGVPASRPLAIAWNVLGLVDLFTAVGAGTGILLHVPPAAALGLFPTILVPTLGVPVAVILHVICLSRLPAGLPQVSASNSRSTSAISL